MISQTNMKRWSDAKLDKELAFAMGAKDENDPANLEWLAACEAEAFRRFKLGFGPSLHNCIGS